jgi:hypothetical protein
MKPYICMVEVDANEHTKPCFGGVFILSPVLFPLAAFGRLFYA